MLNHRIIFFHSHPHTQKHPFILEENNLEEDCLKDQEFFSKHLPLSTAKKVLFERKIRGTPGREDVAIPDTFSYQIHTKTSPLTWG